MWSKPRAGARPLHCQAPSRLYQTLGKAAVPDRDKRVPFWPNMPIMLIEESASYRFPDTPEQLREAQNHRNATLAGQQENRRGPLGVRKPLSISHYQTRIREKSNGNGKWRGISERFPEKFCDSPASLVRMGRSRTLRGLSRQSHHAPCQRRIYRNATKYPRMQR
jgi:hypothetical protein